MPRMVNQTFWRHPGHYFLQCLLIIIFMALVLFPLGSLEASVFTAIGASTLASSIITMFAVPKSPVAAIHRVIGGYAIGILVGIVFHIVLLFSIAKLAHSGLDKALIIDLVGSVTVGITMLIMALLDFLHPPSAGLALAIVIGPWNHWTICVILVGVLILCFIKYILRNWFINLL